MFEGNERCSLCNSGLVHGNSHKRTDIDGRTHAFCSGCIEKKDEVHKCLGLKH